MSAPPPRIPVFTMVAVWAAAGCAGLTLSRWLRPAPPPPRRRVHFTEAENEVLLITPRQSRRASTCVPLVFSSHLPNTNLLLSPLRHRSSRADRQADEQEELGYIRYIHTISARDETDERAEALKLALAAAVEEERRGGTTGGDERAEALKLALAAAVEEERRGGTIGGVTDGSAPTSAPPALPRALLQPQEVQEGSLAQLPILRLDGTRVASAELQPKLVALCAPPLNRPLHLRAHFLVPLMKSLQFLSYLTVVL